MVSVVEDPMAGFLYALRSPISKEISTEGVFKEDAIEFLKKARENPQWVEDKLMQFISSQIERLNRGEVAAATISNYYKAVKLFLEMNRITLSWKIICRGVPTETKQQTTGHQVSRNFNVLWNFLTPVLSPSSTQ